MQLFPTEVTHFSSTIHVCQNNSLKYLGEKLKIESLLAPFLPYDEDLLTGISRNADNSTF